MNIEKVEKYLGLAQSIAEIFSKDSSTKVGAIILGPDNEVRSIGYNGAPRGCAADEDARGVERPEKYFWFSHAELNAITNAARVGTPLAGTSLVVTHPPCMDCARAIVQAGIKAVYCPKPTSEFLSRWDDHITRSIRLFVECNVAYTFINRSNNENHQSLG